MIESEGKIPNYDHSIQWRRREVSPTRHSAVLPSLQKHNKNDQAASSDDTPDTPEKKKSRKSKKTENPATGNSELQSEMEEDKEL